MCGIVGVFGPSAPALKERLYGALSAIAHRGPDGEGTYESPDGQCLLGHRRLAILDLSSAASQPFLRDHSALVYNGEIYNHSSLRYGLGHGESFRSHSDTETVSRLLLQEGPRALARAEGMFAGAFYDEKKAELHLFRDPMGIKPVYLATLRDSTVLFASEVKALLAFDPGLARASLEAVATYMAFENLPPGRTLFEGVTLLPLGEALTLTLSSSGKVVTSRRSLRYESGLSSEESTTGAAASRISSAVDDHLLSDVPLAVYLSGGLDSGLVASLAARRSRELVAYTGFFEGVADPHYDETPLAELLAKKLGIAWRKVAISAADLQRDLDPLIRALDEPRMGMGTFPQYVVARAAAKERKVVLAGHGGDELFAGYPLFKAFWVGESGLSRDTLYALSKTRAKEWPWLIHHSWHSLLGKRRPFAPRIFSRRVSRSALVDRFEARGEAPPLEELRKYYWDIYLPGLLLVEDKISMAHGLETRVPLWSQSLAVWAGRISARELMPRGALKGLLRNVARDWLPEEFFRAPKRGFPTPLRLWFRGPLRGFVRERLLDTGVDLRPFVDKRQIESLIRSHERVPLPFALDERRAHRLWILLGLESWVRQFKIQFGDVSP